MNSIILLLILKKKHLQCSESLHRNVGKSRTSLVQEKVAAKKLAPAILDTVGKPCSCSVQWNWFQNSSINYRRINTVFAKALIAGKSRLFEIFY